eukprot:4879734-Alexandrium_andersonii.AAC.1
MGSTAGSAGPQPPTTRLQPMPSRPDFFYGPWQVLNCRTCEIASGVRSWSCAGTGMASHDPPCKASSAGFG